MTPLGQPMQMDAAHIAAIKRSVFARPQNPMAPMQQTMQGKMGPLGAAQGRPQGFIGAAVPQMGAQKAPGAAATPAPGFRHGAPAPGRSTGPISFGTPGGGGPQGGQGLGQFAPLILAVLSHFFANGGLSGLFGGGGTGGGGMFGGHTGIGHGGL